MLSLASFVVIGVLCGLFVPFPAFAIFSLVVLIAYSALTSGFSGLGRAFDFLFAAVALQVGYFLSVLAQTMLLANLKRMKGLYRPRPQSVGGSIYDPGHWLRRAKEMRSLASKTNDPFAKATLLRVAEEYDRLATHAAERSKTRKPAA